MAEMIAARTNWKFMELTDKIVEVDPKEYFLNDLKKLIAILKHFLE
jgi:Fe-S-cluster formation regulator IscX/YfhJ